MKTLCIVTGASKGFGKATVKQVLLRYPTSEEDTVHFVICARTLNLLNDLKLEIESDKCTVSCVTFDCADVSSIEPAVNEIFDSMKDMTFDKHVLVNNAGSIGNLDQMIRDYTHTTFLLQYVQLNFISLIPLTSRFLQEYKDKEKVIVNVSSLLAVKAFKGWGMYASIKAARDMFHSVIAEEEQASNTKTLNYAPGPLDTDMQKEVRETICDTEQKSIYSNMFEKGQLISPEESARKLVLTLIENSFTSGSHIDYYDLII